MAPQDLDEQLTKYLTDIHSIEEQALAQMRVAPQIAEQAELAAAFRRHLAETERHELEVRQRLEMRGASPSRIKDLAGAATGKAFVLFARSQPDTPGKLTVHAFAYEHMEAAAYDLLGRVAARADDAQTGELARRLGDQERAMAGRLEGLFDQAAAASLRNVAPAELPEQLTRYLADAHAIEAQAIGLLEKGPALAGSDQLAHVYAEHLEETRAQQRSVRERLEAHGAGPSRVQDAAMRLGALNWGAFFAAQPDTPAKLAGFAFAFEHLEIAGYELLRRVAERAGDSETAHMADRIAGQERAAAQSIHALFDDALESSLRAQEISA